MVYNLSLISCSEKTPDQEIIVEFWDWLGEKRTGIFHDSNIFSFFVEYKTGLIYFPIKDIAYWKYKD